jgi:hypothetical protein
MSARWAEGGEDPRLAVIVRAGGRGSHVVVPVADYCFGLRQAIQRDDL